MITVECTDTILILLRCGIQERSQKDVSDQYSWWCPQCKGRKTIRTGSFFEKSKLSLNRLLFIIHFWSRQLPVTDAELQLEISRSTAIDIYQWFREVCSTKLLATPIVLGGPGTVVEIDESLFNHKPKVKLTVYP